MAKYAEVLPPLNSISSAKSAMACREGKFVSVLVDIARVERASYSLFSRGYGNGWRSFVRMFCDSVFHNAFFVIATRSVASSRVASSPSRRTC